MDAVQFPAPVIFFVLKIAQGQPRWEFPIGRRGVQSGGRILVESQEFPLQHRIRPSVEQRMVACPDDLYYLVFQQKRCCTQNGRTVQLAWPEALSSEKRGQP